MTDHLSGLPDTGPKWPATLDVPGMGLVRLVQPGLTYPAGSTLAVFWPHSPPPVAPSVLRSRAETLGRPWQPSVAIPMIGVQLAQKQLGYTVVNTLTGGAWTVNDAMVVPFEVPAGSIADGITAGDLAAGGAVLKDAAGAFAGAMQGVVGSGATVATGAAWFLTALPWLLLAAGAVVGGVWIYRKVKT